VSKRCSPSSLASSVVMPGSRSRRRSSLIARPWDVWQRQLNNLVVAQATPIGETDAVPALHDLRSTRSETEQEAAPDRRMLAAAMEVLLDSMWPADGRSRSHPTRRPAPRASWVSYYPQHRRSFLAGLQPRRPRLISEEGTRRPRSGGRWTSSTYNAHKHAAFECHRQPGDGRSSEAIVKAQGPATA
jgi:hypothetical protein